MDVKSAILRLVNGLKHQDFNFSEKLFPEAFIEDYEYLTGTKKKVYVVLNKLFVEGTVSYEHVNKEEFQGDLERFQNSVDQRMLLSWGYKSGNLVIIGILYADSLSDNEKKSIFTRFDEALVKIMRKHVGRLAANTKGALYGTVMLVFKDPAKAQQFNPTINDYYNSYFWKKIYTSMMTLDSESMTLTQGKGPMGIKWHGAIDIKELRKSLLSDDFENS